jgi:hypothetical protein
VAGAAVAGAAVAGAAVAGAAVAGAAVGVAAAPQALNNMLRVTSKETAKSDLRISLSFFLERIHLAGLPIHAEITLQKKCTKYIIIVFLLLL